LRKKWQLLGEYSFILFIAILPDAKKNIPTSKVLHTSCGNANKLYGVKQSLTLISWKKVHGEGETALSKNLAIKISLRMDHSPYIQLILHLHLMKNLYF